MAHGNTRSDRDSSILEHVARYRSTTRQVLRTRFFPENSTNAVTKVLRRLCREGLLRRYHFYGRRRYFVLGPRGARLLGLPHSRTNSLGSQALPREYATLAYCSTLELKKERLTTKEFSTHFSQYKIDGVDNSHYVVEQSGGGHRLSFLRVDYHGAADHVARKCRLDVDIRLGNPHFTELIESGRFLLVIATGTEEKSAAIRESVGKKSWPKGLRIHVVVIPELVYLLGARSQ